MSSGQLGLPAQADIFTVVDRVVWATSPKKETPDTLTDVIWVVKVASLMLSWLSVVAKSFIVLSLRCCDGLDNSFVVPIEWCSSLITPMATLVPDHQRWVGMNGQMADAFEIRDEINQLKSIDTTQNIRRFRLSSGLCGGLQSGALRLYGQSYHVNC